ncbi:MAG: HAD-IA family hydrolase [Gammaproteobacteria bacterium]|nr:HAD-IA family hydrolase [Gammaproteobacteria bacterium]MDT8370890.1 HAD-IA family hydrolase [Gammaproteobacteria bacterium]
MQNFTAILFDLDGTLVDTAPDLAFALNSLLEEQGMPTLPYETIRPVASNGAGGLLELGFGISDNDDLLPALRDRLLAIYQDNILRESKLFEGMPEVLTALEQANITWGIITNKPAFLTDPLIKALQLTHRAACVVSGDTTPFSKPHPAPMLHACELINIAPEHCLYIGDAARDIEAGKNANMRTVAARYGYVSESDNPVNWQADAHINHPSEILQWI